MFWLLITLLVIAILLEGSVSPFPLVLIMLLCLVIIKRDGAVFFIAFIAGLLLDTFALRSLGGTSIFLLIFVLLLFLYQRKYEINSYQFVFFASFFGSLIYLFLFGTSAIFLLAFFNAITACMLFGLTRLLIRSPLLHHTAGMHYK